MHTIGNSSHKDTLKNNTLIIALERLAGSMKEYTKDRKAVKDGETGSISQT